MPDTTMPPALAFMLAARRCELQGLESLAVTCELVTCISRLVHALQGFKTIINNRPDGEGGGAQPTSPEMERAATVAGLHYVYLPVVSGSITPEQVQAMHKVLITAPKPTLAFCRSGARSAQLFGLAQDLDADAF